MFAVIKLVSIKIKLLGWGMSVRFHLKAVYLSGGMWSWGDHSIFYRYGDTLRTKTAGGG